MQYTRGISTGAAAAAIIVVAILVGGGVYAATSSSAKTVTSTEMISSSGAMATTTVTSTVTQSASGSSSAIPEDLVAACAAEGNTVTLYDSFTTTANAIVVKDWNAEFPSDHSDRDARADRGLRQPDGAHSVSGGQGPGGRHQQRARLPDVAERLGRPPEPSTTPRGRSRGLPAWVHDRARPDTPLDGGHRPAGLQH